MTRLLAAIALASASPSAFAAPAARAEEVEVTAGVVTGVECALAARAKGDLRLVASCPPAEAAKGLVVFDVAEKRIYRLAPRKVSRWQLERAFGGGSIDFTGTTVKVEPKTQIATVAVTEFSITPRPKPGAFKGCL